VLITDVQLGLTEHGHGMLHIWQNKTDYCGRGQQVTHKKIRHKKRVRERPDTIGITKVFPFSPKKKSALRN